MEQLKTECSKLQDEQIRLSTRSAEEDGEIEQMQTKITILEEKKIRLDGDLY